MPKWIIFASKIILHYKQISMLQSPWGDMVMENNMRWEENYISMLLCPFTKLLHSLTKHLNFLTKVMPFPKKLTKHLRSLTNHLCSFTEVLYSWETFACSQKYHSLAKVLHFPKKLCILLQNMHSLLNNLHSLTKPLHSQKYCVPLSSSTFAKANTVFPPHITSITKILRVNAKFLGETQ